MVRLRPGPLGRLLFAVVVAIGAPARAEDSPGLLIETGSPDAFCPDLIQTREAVRRRLGSVEVEGRRGWRASYTIGHAPAGSPRDFVRLELYNPEGVTELVRDLPMSGESCATMAEVIALVLDRHFRSLSPEEREMTSADAARVPETKPAPAAAARPAPAQPPATSSDASLLLMAEFALAAQRPPAFGIRMLAPLGPSLQLGSALLFDVGFEHEQLAMGGDARAARGELRAWLAWRTRTYPWFLYLGPSLGLGLQRGETQNLPERSSLLRAFWAAGLETGGVWCVSPHLGVELSGALSATWPSLWGRFYVDDREVLELRVLSAQIGLAAGYAF